MREKKIFDFEKELSSPSLFDRRRENLALAHQSQIIAVPDAFVVPEAGQSVNNIIAPNPESTELRSQASEEAHRLMQRIIDNQNRLKQYQNDVERAKNIPNNIFNRKRIEEQRRVNERHIVEILQEQNDLIKNNIVFSIRSIEFASYLGQELGQLIEYGFRSRDGHIQRISGQTRELAMSMLQQIRGIEEDLKDSDSQIKN